MKQVIVRQFGGVEQLELSEQPTPVPGLGQVRIRFTSIGLNHAELMARKGLYKLVSGDPPFTPGLEGGGVIDAMGPNVTERQVGQRVVLGPEAPRPHIAAANAAGGATASGGGGTYRSHYICAPQQAWPAPDALPDNQLGAIWLSYLTAWGCLAWKQKMRSGDFVALPAASSSVALAAAQVVRQYGGISIGLTTRADKVERIRALPEAAFDHLIVTHEQGKPRPWHEDLKRITAGHGIDIFFDPVAAGEYLTTEIHSLAKRGTIWVYGLLGKPGPVDVHPLIRKFGAIRGWAVNELIEDGPAVSDAGCESVLQGFASGIYHQHIDRVFPLDKVRDAHAYMEKGEHIGKLVMVP